MKKTIIHSQISNAKTVQMYQRQLLTLAENVFEFVNLPTYIDTAYMNKQLLRKGSIAFFKDDVLDEILALPYTVIGNLDVYNRPVKIKAFGENGYTKELNKDDFIIMYDNNGRYPLYLDIIQSAERIALNKRVIDINITQQKTPRIWKVTSEKKKTIEDLVNEIDSCVDAVEVYDSLEVEDLDVVMAPAPFVADKIDLHLEKEWAEFFRLIGVANLTEQKRERLIKDEMQASQGGTIASRYSRFEPRYKAINEINKKWNLNIEVRYYDGVPTSKKEVDDNVISEFISDEDITNN